MKFSGMTFNMPFSTWRLTCKSFSIHWTSGIGHGPLPLLKAFCFWPGIKVKSVKTKIWPWVNHKYYVTAWKGRADFMNIVLLWFLVFHNKKHNISLVFISDIRHRWNIAFMLHEMWSHHRGSAGHAGENQFTNRSCPICVISLQYLHYKQVFISDDMKGLTLGKSLCRAHSYLINQGHGQKELVQYFMCIILIPAFTLTQLQKTANLVVKSLGGPPSFCLLYCHYPWMPSKTLIHTNIFFERLQRPHLFPLLTPTSSYLRCYATSNSQRDCL